MIREIKVGTKLKSQVVSKESVHRYKIAVCTLFRSCVNDVIHSFKQRAEWNNTLQKIDIVHVCVEGDSEDDTYGLLESYKDKFDIRLIKHDTGNKHYPSVADPDRLKTLGYLSNIALDKAMEESPTHILWLDSDVTLPRDYIPTLLSHQRDVVAPMFYFEKSIYFRDTWGYRVKEEQFTNRYPYCKNFNPKSLFEVDSVGLPLINAKVIKSGAKFGNEEIVDLCRSIRSLGYKIFVDPTVAVTHPRHGTIVPENHER